MPGPGADHRASLLHDAERRLSLAAGEDETARAVATLAVPHLGDWCSVHVLGDDGRLRAVAIAHADPDRRALADAYVTRYPPRPDAPRGPARVARTGETEVVRGLTPAELRAGAQDAAHAELLLAIGPRSYVSVPLRARERVVGVLTLCYAESAREHGPTEVALAENLARLAGAALENAELLRAEREARALLAAQNEAAPDGIFFQSADGRTAFYNEKLLKMWGVDESVPAHATLEERLAASMGRLEDPDAFVRLALELEKERDRVVRVDVRVKGGQIFDCYTSPVRAPDGAFLGRVWYYRDVTAQRAMEAELARARRQVVESERLAFMGTLVSGVAHEVRTPLAYVSNHAHLLRLWAERARKADAADAPDLDSLVASADAIVEGVERMNRLVGELRRFTRPSSEDPVEVDVDEATQRAALLFQAAYRGRVVLEVDYGRAGRVRMMHGQLEQVVLNLLENAADASPPGARVRVATSQGPRGEARLVVQDWGSGIPEDVQKRMFEPFFTTKAEGLGLGLGIVRRILEEHGGTMRCESVPTVGTTFVVSLPQA